MKLDNIINQQGGTKFHLFNNQENNEIFEKIMGKLVQKYRNGDN